MSSRVRSGQPARGQVDAIVLTGQPSRAGRPCSISAPSPPAKHPAGGCEYTSCTLPLRSPGVLAVLPTSRAHCRVTPPPLLVPLLCSPLCSGAPPPPADQGERESGPSTTATGTRREQQCATAADLGRGWTLVGWLVDCSRLANFRKKREK